MMAIDQPLPDGRTVSDQRATVGIGQGDASAQLAAKDLVVPAEEVVLLGQVFAEELLDLGDEGSGGAGADGISFTGGYKL